MKNYPNEVSVVTQSEHVAKENVIVSYHSWSEVAAEEFAGFLENERKLTTEEIRMYAEMWGELVLENAPLRAVVNGTVLSVSEDFYDFIIWNRLTENTVKECSLDDVQIYSGFSSRVMLESHVYANKCGRKDYGD